MTGAVVRFQPNSEDDDENQRRSSGYLHIFQANKSEYNTIVALSYGFRCATRQDENSGTERSGGGLMYFGLNGGSN
jgi:hypothetical protein